MDSPAGPRGTTTVSPLLGCIADDYTGGTDVAAALHRAGARTVLFFDCPADDATLPLCDAVVVALKTRTIASNEAVEETLRAREWLARQGTTRLFFKYCSTFDSTEAGNIGPVADALLDATGTELTVVCPAAPEHGRTVYQGHLFVGDRLLSESSMRHHPLTPMTDPDLVRLLGRQTPHAVELVPLSLVREGPDALRARLETLQDRGIRFAVTDAVCDADLTTVAHAGADLGVLTGAAGLARAVGEVSATGIATSASVGHVAGPTIVLAGSCSDTTLGQVARASSTLPSHRLDLSVSATPDALRTDALRWLRTHADGRPLMVYSSAPPGQRADIDAAEVFERTLGAVAAEAVRLGYRRLVVAGGETSGAVVSAVGVESVEIGAEADRGVPWCISTGEPRLALLLKSGNFGAPDLLLLAATQAVA
ncbi:four-carbon acid sugar kinase family protein [Streptomyces sp. DT2A-34]|uniref:3-oxo-tetronate kinase n=1 Tax=Streptomyces sp. DT2A-34 TaxID=3051182 RepID=UPI00265BE440|nr:3-oxo-tetronate kinase [Streptomyces sp. DT2A-34]MDO0916649.1 four-carbon acid sugar kinase family protein [Streptomyces sp. DT2A-34]